MKLGRAYRKYWMHVLPDGTEVAYWEQPRGIPTTVVLCRGRWEYTFNYNIEGYQGTAYCFRSHMPRGARWEICDDRADKWTGWRRKRL